MNVCVDIFRPRGFPDLLAIRFYAGRAYLETTLGLSTLLADSVEIDGLTLLAEHLRKSSQRHVAFFEDLHVPRELRGQGVGSLLLKRALVYMRKIGVREVYLQASAESNIWQKSVVRLYERFGFTEAADMSQYGPVLVKVLRGARSPKR